MAGGTETSTAQSPTQRSEEPPLDRPTTTTKMMMKKLATVGLIGLGLVSAPNAVFGRSLLQEEASDLPLGMTEGQLADITNAVSECSGDWSDIEALWQNEVADLIALVEAETTTVTAQSKAKAEAETVVEEVAKVDYGKLALAVLESEEWDALMASEELAALSEEMELDCVMKNEAFASLFQNMLASNGIDESSPMHAVAKQAPAIAGGYYACGGRIKPVLEFVEGVAPGMLGGGGFDPMSVLAAPEFMALQASGFDMACFFGVPEVSGLLGSIMG